MAGFKDTLKQAVRQLAYRTSVESLKKQGVQHVSVLGIDRVVGLVEEAVHRGLKSRLVGLEREAVTDAAKSEFLRLLRSNEDLQREKSEVQKLKERAEEEIDLLRRQLEQQEHALEIKLAENALEDLGRYEGENARIAARVRDMFAGLGRDPQSLGSVQERVLELVMTLVEDERKSSEAARQALRDREVENMQRRLKKLTESLEQTEHRLREVAALKNIDQGISSIYRTVQGLQESEAQFGKKKDLMSAIFEANLRLQKKPS